MWYTSSFIVLIYSDTINSQVHETMKTTPYELVFGQPPRSVIAPDSTVGGIIDETAIQLDDTALQLDGTAIQLDETAKQLDDGSNDDGHCGNGYSNQEDIPSRSRSYDVDNVLKSRVSISLQ